MNLTLVFPEADRNKLYKRKGFNQSPTSKPVEKPVSIIPEHPPILVYEAAKLGHSGITAYKVFENCNRRFKASSIHNLLSSTVHGSETLDWLVSQYKACVNNIDRSSINNQASALLDQNTFDTYLTLTRQSRHMNAAQSRKVRQMSEKLAYYSATRVFKSKKTGTYKMKVAFLTLTTPETATPQQALAAFDTFLDYLARTANCRYVWKKELGDEGHHLHFHLLINNFVPYYIIAWKWKRALIAQGVNWPLGSDGKGSNSHYRIEIPKSKGQVAKYIAKYLSKAYDMPAEYGYLAGWSRVLNSLKEIVVYTGDSLHNEVRAVVKECKKIVRDYVSFFCCDLLAIKDKFPAVGAVFEQQYIKFCEVLTLPQKFHIV